MPTYSFICSRGCSPWDQYLSLNAFDFHKATGWSKVTCPACGTPSPKLQIHAVPCTSIDGEQRTGPFDPNDITSVPELANCTFKNKKEKAKAEEALGILPKGEMAKSSPKKKRSKKKSNPDVVARKGSSKKIKRVEL